jgi:hypothetical protein
MCLVGSETAIQTNGFISEYFQMSRSIKQSCPIAPFLYVLQAEPMACAIRNNINIHGIKLPSLNGYELELKVSQFVDDTFFL